MVIKMPSGSDPDAFLREKGPAAFAQLMEQGQDYLTFLVAHEGRTLNIDSPAAKNELVVKISQQIREWENPLMVHESLRKLAHLTRVPENIVGVGQDQIQSIYVKHSGTLGMQSVDPNRVLEADLLRWLLLMGESHPHLMVLAKEYLKPEDFHVTVCQQLYQVYLDAQEEQKATDLLSLVIQLDDAEGQLFLSELLQKKVNRERVEEHFRETIQRMLDRNWMQKREEIRMKIQSGRYSDQEAAELAKQFDELKRNRSQVKNEESQ